jgi:PAS domain S-box-containing protein
MEKHSQVLPVNYRAKWRKSLPFKISAVQLIITFMLISSTLWLILSVQRQQQLEQQQRVNLSYGQIMVSRLIEATSQIEELAMSIGNLAKLYRNDHQQLQLSVPVVLDLERQRELVISGGIWPEPGAFDTSATGTSFFWARNSLGKLAYNSDYNRDGAIDYRQQDWYKPLRHFPSTQAFWSKSYRDPYTQEAMVTASVPMWHSHEFIGVATVDMSLNGIARHLTQGPQNLAGYVITLDRNNNIIFFPHKSATRQYSLMSFKQLSNEQPQYRALYRRLTRKQSAGDEQRPQSRAGNADLGATTTLTSMADNDSADLLHKGVGNSPLAPYLLHQFQLPRDTLLGTAALVSVYLMPNTQWKVIAFTPLTSFEHDAKLVTGEVGLYLILIQLLALLLLFLLQRKLFIAPVSEIVTALVGNNAQTLELEASQREDEIGALAKAFIARTKQLETTMAELDASNNALEDQLRMQHEAKQELNKYKDQLTALLRSSEHLIYIKALDGRYLLVNDKYCEVLGIEKHQLLQASDRELFPAILAKIFHDNDQRVLNANKTISFEEPIPTTHGNVVYLMTKFSILDKEEQPNAIGAIGIDLSAKKQLESQYIRVKKEARLDSQAQTQRINSLKRQLSELTLQQTRLVLAMGKGSQLRSSNLNSNHLMQELMTELISQLMHVQDELIVGLCTLSEHYSDPRLDDFMSRMTKQADWLRHAFQLLGNQQNGVKPLHLSQILFHIAQLIGPQFDRQGVTLLIHCEPHILVEGNAWHYLLLFYRLLINSLHHAFSDPALGRLCEQKQIELRIERRSHFLEIDIEDNGRGLSEESERQLQRALDAQQCIGTLSNLAVWLQTQLQGELSISSPPEKGCRIHCHIPITADDSDQSSSQRPLLETGQTPGV